MSIVTTDTTVDKLSLIPSIKTVRYENDYFTGEVATLVDLSPGPNNTNRRDLQ